MSDDARIRKVSKFLSLVLRHNPQSIGLELDGNGWAEIDQLIALARKNGQELDRSLVNLAVVNNAKQRFAISEDERRIRARQGHSIPVDLGLEPRVPPDRLFHGTATRFVDSIFAEGLRSRSRNHVHLSLDEETAVTVGRRHGKVIVLLVDAARMHGNGLEFYLSENGVWLTAEVPPGYLSVLGG